MKWSSGAGTGPANAGMGTGCEVESVGWMGMTNATSSFALVKSAGLTGRARCPRSGHCQDGMAMAFSSMAS